jgi:hypothetical protein
MNTYEDYITHKGNEFYLCTEYAFDQADRLQLDGFALWDNCGEEVSQEDFEADKDFYDHVCTVLANYDAPCYGGAPC